MIEAGADKEDNPADSCGGSEWAGWRVKLC